LRSAWTTIGSFRSWQNTRFLACAHRPSTENIDHDASICFVVEPPHRVVHPVELDSGGTGDVGDGVVPTGQQQHVEQLALIEILTESVPEVIVDVVVVVQGVDHRNQRTLAVHAQGLVELVDAGLVEQDDDQRYDVTSLGSDVGTALEPPLRWSTMGSRN
jgi:hypothetical protein